MSLPFSADHGAVTAGSRLVREKALRMIGAERLPHACRYAPLMVMSSKGAV